MLGDAWPPFLAPRALAWLAQPCPALSGAPRRREAGGQGGAGVTSAAITSHFSLQPR